jgi:hypothetical protein
MIASRSPTVPQVDIKWGPLPHCKAHTRLLATFDTVPSSEIPEDLGAAINACRDCVFAQAYEIGRREGLLQGVQASVEVLKGSAVESWWNTPGIVDHEILRRGAFQILKEVKDPGPSVSGPGWPVGAAPR